MRALWQWFRILISGRPHFIVGSPEAPYLRRWFLLPRNPFFRIYLHHFCRSDDDRALHDHPWWFVSLMIWGRYTEVYEYNGVRIAQRRSAPSMVFRPATHRHRVFLNTGSDGRPRPCWTIIITGRKVREWGFWCPQGFVPWYQFVSRSNSGEVGPGCDGPHK